MQNSFIFLFLYVLDCIQEHKIVEEHTFLPNIYVKFQDKMLVRKFLTELLYGDFEHTAVVIIVL